jgi:hypothetical protein
MKPNVVVVWRVLIVVAILLSSGAIFIGAKVLSNQDDAITDNRSTICSIGAFLTQSPLIRVQGTSQKVFVGQLVTTRKFLTDLRDIDCAGIGYGREVSRADIDRQLARIHDVLKDARGRRSTGGSNASRNPPRGDHPGGSPADAGPGAPGSGGPSAGGDPGPAPGEPPGSGGSPPGGNGPPAGPETPPSHPTTKPPSLGDDVKNAAGAAGETAGNAINSTCATAHAATGIQVPGC